MTNQTNNPVVLIYILWIFIVNYACLNRDVSEVPYQFNRTYKNAMKQSALNEDSFVVIFWGIWRWRWRISATRDWHHQRCHYHWRRTGFLHRYKLPGQISGENKLMVNSRSWFLHVVWLKVFSMFSDTRFPTDTVDFDVFIGIVGHVSNTGHHLVFSSSVIN